MKIFLEITDVYAREVLDSRANPTVEVEVVIDDTYIGRAAVLRVLRPELLRPLN